MDTSEVLEAAEAALDHVATFIELFVVAEFAMALLIVAFSTGVVCYLFKLEDEESPSSPC